jgi:hypothetical protein
MRQTELSVPLPFTDFFLGLSFDPEDGSDVSPETSSSLLTAVRYNPEDLTLHSHRCEDLKYKISIRFIIKE